MSVSISGSLQRSYINSNPNVLLPTVGHAPHRHDNAVAVRSERRCPTQPLSTCNHSPSQLGVSSTARTASQPPTRPSNCCTTGPLSYLERQQHLPHDALSTGRCAELAIGNLQPQRPLLWVDLAAHDVRLHLVHLERHAALQACRAEVAHQQCRVGAQHQAAPGIVRHKVHLAHNRGADTAARSAGTAAQASMVGRSCGPQA